MKILMLFSVKANALFLSKRCDSKPLNSSLNMIFFCLFYSEKMGWKSDGLHFNLHHSFKHTFASALHLQRSSILRVNLCLRSTKHVKHQNYPDFSEMLKMCVFSY